MFDSDFRQAGKVISIQGEQFFCAGFLCGHRMQIIVDAPAANTFFSRLFQRRQDLRRGQIVKVQVSG